MFLSPPATPTLHPNSNQSSPPSTPPLAFRPRALFSDSPPSPPAAHTVCATDPTAVPLTVVDQFKNLFNYHHSYRNRYHQSERQESQLSTINLSNNLPWGDDLSLSKSPHTFRLYYQNINGIKLDESGGDLDSICSTIKELGCDLYGFSETKLDVSKYSVKKIMSASFKTYFRHHRYAASTSAVPFEGYYKPGGTMTGCVDHQTSRYFNSYDDPLGRWSTITMQGKFGKLIHFITIYQVVNKETSGPYTAYQQQLQSLRLADRDLTPRRALLLDLDKYMKALRNTTSEFVVMGDLNEVVGKDPSGFAKITSEFDLVDILGHFHSVKDEVATYARGTDRIDYVFCTAPLLPAIVACGAEPFNQHIFSDHRALFVDWDELRLFGSPVSQIVSHSQRRLQSKCQPSRTKYINYLHNYCVDHNVFQRQRDLCVTPNPDLAESIDRTITRGMIAAEARCRHLGVDPWSVCLQKARLHVEILKHALSMLRIGLDNRQKIERLLGQYATPLDIPDDLVSLKIALNAAQIVLRQVRNDAAEHRKTYLQSKVLAARVNQQPAKRKAAQRIAKAEDMKALHAKLRFISRDSDQQSGLNRLEVPAVPNQDPKTCTEWTSVDTPEEITKYLLERNRNHFAQAQGTPFTVSPLKFQVDFGATTASCEAMLCGAYDSTTFDTLTGLVIEHFQSATEMDKLASTITRKAMMDKYKFWPETTSTSPSGRHLGHYRALLPALRLKSKANAELNTKRQELVAMHHAVTEYALDTGYSYRRWQKVVNVMLEKEPGNPKIHRLRVIHLYEADYNLILGVKWRELIHHCEDNHLLHPSLYGARPGRGALEPVYTEELINEITRLSRKPVIKNAEDATACYDRIIPGIGNLASRSHGLHRQVALVQGRTLEEIRYHLKTQMGVTDEHYQHCSISPIYGTGQGSGNSPTIWLVVSSILFRCYSAKAYGASFETPDRSIRIDIFRVGFVDDTCGYVNRFLSDVPPTPADLIDLLKHDSQLWSDLLWKSGGALELPKCTYHFSYYKFATDGTPFLQCGQVGPTVNLLTGDLKQTQTVPSSSVYKAYKTLGCYKSPSGAQQTQFQKLEEKCLRHARIVSTSALTPLEGWTYYFSKYLTSPGYPLPVCHFTGKQLTSLEKKVLPAIFSRCGFNRNTSRNILFGPARLNGGGFRPFSTEQGVGQLQYFVKNWTHQLEIGQLLRVAVAWAQINVGVGYSIFEDVTSSLPHFESKWLDSLRQFLRLIQGRLRLDKTFVPEIQRVNDSHIMDHVLERGNFTPSQIRKINYCRLYLQVVTVSDIATANGTHLAPGIRDGNPTIWSGQSTHHKTNQGNPDIVTWRLWSRALSLIATSRDVLLVPLRQWIVPPSRQRQVWIVYYDPGSDSLYFPKAGVYEKHKNRNGFFNYNFSGSISKLPEQAYPVSIEEYPPGWHVVSYNSYCPVLPSLPPSSFEDFCSLLAPWESQLLATVQFQFSPFNLMAILVASSFNACSDGSAVALEGTYGWVLSSEDGTRLAYGSGPVDGHDPRSFRAEGQGMLSVACLLRRLIQWTCTTEPITGVLATDNTGLIHRVKSQGQLKYPVPNATFKPDWDVVQAIVDTLSTCSIEASYVHVKGHQDDDTPLEELGLLAQLNVEADKYAGEYRALHGSYRPVIPLSPTRPVALDIGGKTIHRGFKQAIRDSIHGTHLLEAMQLRYEWADGVIDMIDWDVHRQSTHANSNRRTHYVKLCHDILPTGNLVSRYGQGLPDYCPLCKSPDEDFHHVLQCPHRSRVKWRNDLLVALTTKCRAIKTDPTLQEILLDGLSSWLQLQPFSPDEYPEEYRQLLTEQSLIGWDHFFQGRISTQWAVLQQQYYSSFPPVKGRDGQSWSRNILCQIFTCWNQLWDARNTDRHGKDETSQSVARKEQVIRELSLLYSYRHTILHRDQSIFLDTLEEHQLKPTHSIRQWINTHQPIILKSAKDAKSRSLLHVRTITHYFGAG